MCTILSMGTTVPILQIRKQRQGTGKLFAQGHMGGEVVKSELTPKSRLPPAALFHQALVF